MARKSLTERTQKLRDSKGGLVGDGVNDGFVGVGVCVVVAVKVGEGVPVALAVAVKGSGVEVDVEEETGVGVGGGGSVPGLKRKASRMIIPISAGMAYRAQIGRDFTFWYGVTTGGFPVYPSALSIFLKFSSYSPVEKFE